MILWACCIAFGLITIIRHKPKEQIDAGTVVAYCGAGLIISMGYMMFFK